MCISFPPTLTMMHLCITQCTYWTPLGLTIGCSHAWHCISRRRLYTKNYTASIHVSLFTFSLIKQSYPPLPRCPQDFLDLLSRDERFLTICVPDYGRMHQHLQKMNFPSGFVEPPTVKIPYTIQGYVHRMLKFFALEWSTASKSKFALITETKNSCVHACFSGIV